MDKNKPKKNLKIFLFIILLTISFIIFLVAKPFFYADDKKSINTDMRLTVFKDEVSKAIEHLSKSEKRALKAKAINLVKNHKVYPKNPREKELTVGNVAELFLIDTLDKTSAAAGDWRSNKEHKGIYTVEYIIDTEPWSMHEKHAIWTVFLKNNIIQPEKHNLIQPENDAANKFMKPDLKELKRILSRH